MPKRRQRRPSSPLMYVVHTTTWGHKIGHTSSSVEGLYPSWKDAFHKTMTDFMNHVWEQEDDGNGPKPVLPTNEAELKEVVTRRKGIIWTYKEGSHLEFWDGEGEGATMHSITAVHMKPENKAAKSGSNPPEHE